MSFLKHYGTPRHSGRYPWGSGENGYQRYKDFLGTVHELEKQGLSEIEIAKGLGMTTSELRKKKTTARAEKHAADVAAAIRFKEKGMSNVAIGERMGLNESSVRALLDPANQQRSEVIFTVADILADNVAEKKYIDIGSGVEAHLGISRTKMDGAIRVLEENGYTIHYLDVKQVGTGKYTRMKILAAPGTEYSEISKNRYDVKSITNYSDDGGISWNGLEPPISVSKNRIFVRHGPEGGEEKDGLIELRRGVDDISLGNARYAQVRIAVEGDKYMKGMAVYSDSIPDGFDIVYNTNKDRGSPKVFKSADTDDEGRIDPTNPFGTIVRQKHYQGADGKEHLSALNIVNEEGGDTSWTNWSRNLSSQVLSKQKPELAKKQLGLAYDLRQEEFDEIMAITNPGVKKLLLKSFSDEADSAAVHLKAAAMPRQATHVLLPFTSIKENEVYAPNYDDGENVVLIRHPHGGIFEIPELIVNNKNQEAKKAIGSAKDAIGINPKVAKRLSGADFDGDTVIVIPNKNGNIKTSSPLKGLKDFDGKKSYPGYPGMPPLTEEAKQMKMGRISNLITDMTIKGANDEEIARAVRHSMVVIDASVKKHNLNYKQSEIDNGIAALNKKYQGKTAGGAATLISRAKSPLYVPFRKEGKLVDDPVTGKKKRVLYDPDTGEKLYEIKEETYTNRQGKVVKRMMKSSKMAETKDAFKLSSGSRMENIYAEHANKLKALGNKARKAIIDTEDTPYSPEARKTYDKEVRSLNSKLVLALRNKPMERQAQLLANKVVSAKRRARPNMEASDLKKVKGQALEEARARMKSNKEKKITILDREWEAIQAGAISKTTLFKILQNTDLDAIKQRAMPRTKKGMSPARIARAKSMLSSGYAASDVARTLGVSVDTLNRAID